MAKWVRLSERATRLVANHGEHLTDVERTFLESLAKRNIVWGTPRQIKMLIEIEQRFTLQAPAGGGS